MKKKEMPYLALSAAILVVLALGTFAFSSPQLTGHPIFSPASCLDSNPSVAAKIPGTLTVQKWYGSYTLRDRCDAGIKKERQCINDIPSVKVVECTRGCNEDDTACAPETFSLSTPAEEMPEAADTYITAWDETFSNAEEGDIIQLASSSTDETALPLRLTLLEKDVPPSDTETKSCTLFSLAWNAPRNTEVSSEDIAPETQIPRINTDEDCSYIGLLTLQKEERTQTAELLEKKIEELQKIYERYCVRKTQGSTIALEVCEVPNQDVDRFGTAFGREKSEGAAGTGGMIKMSITFGKKR